MVGATLRHLGRPSSRRIIFSQSPENTMKLVSDWRRVLRYAWSIRLLLAAAILSGLEVVLPYLGDAFPIPTGAFAALTFFVTVLAFVMRIVSQKDFRDE